jgi:hypothetical protein
MPDPKDAPKPEYDAVLVGRFWPPARTERDRHQALNRLLGPRLGVKVVYPHHVVPHGLDLVLPRPGAPAYYFATTSHRHGEERYDWTEPDADGVRYGTLKPDDEGEPPPSLPADAAPPGGR